MLPIQARFCLVVGARPNFMKAAPILRAFETYPQIDVTLLHTGQHYDAALSDVFFQELGMRRPDVMLNVGSGSHATQTAQVMIKFEEFLLAEKAKGRNYAGVIVVGDVNSTMACAIAAGKLSTPVIHVEAGLRSGDRSMPEEINRIVTDSISDWMLCSEPAGVDHLIAEGRPRDRIKLVGNVMIDTLLAFKDEAKRRTKLAELGLRPGEYGVVTLHRPANVDDPALLGRLLERLRGVSKRVPLVFSVHPRTAERIGSLEQKKESRSANRIAATNDETRLMILPPLGYLDFLCLTSQAKLIITDSGGLQDESTPLGIPCLTLRPNTERPITVEEGTSRLVGDDLDLLDHLVDSVLEDEFPIPPCPALWDGKASERIVRLLAETVGAGPPMIERTPTAKPSLRSGKTRAIRS